jgi:hypothetical protein
MVDGRQLFEGGPSQHEPKCIDMRRDQKMNSSLNHGSAKIYQFPAGGRAALGGRRDDEPKSAIEQGASRVIETVCSGAWYHEAAIQESKPAGER